MSQLFPPVPSAVFHAYKSSGVTLFVCANFAHESPPAARAYLLHWVEMPVWVGEGACGAPLALVADGEVDAGGGGELLERFATAEDGLAGVVVVFVAVPLELVAAIPLPEPSLPTRACEPAFAPPGGGGRGT